MFAFVAHARCAFRRLLSMEMGCRNGQGMVAYRCENTVGDAHCQTGIKNLRKKFGSV